jgi:hypothetical protein
MSSGCGTAGAGVRELWAATGQPTLANGARRTAGMEDGVLTAGRQCPLIGFGFLGAPSSIIPLLIGEGRRAVGAIRRWRLQMPCAGSRFLKRQAIDHFRLIHNEKPWKQLTGNRRLADVVAECDERGWDALPLAAKKLARLLRTSGPRRKPPNVGSLTTSQRYTEI